MHKESGIPPLEVLFHLEKATASERYNRYSEDCKLRQLASINPRAHRLKKSEAWNVGAEKILVSVGLDVRREGAGRGGGEPPLTHACFDVSCRDPLLNHSALPPWECSFIDRITFNWQLPTGGRKKSEIPVEEQREISETQLTSLGNFDVLISSDGTVNEEGTTYRIPCGAAASVIMYNDGSRVERMVPAGYCAHALKSELEGFKKSMKYVANRKKGPVSPQDAILLVITDSQALIRLLESGPFNAENSSDRSMWWQISKWMSSGINNTRRIVFQHVFSHCGVPMNERADELAEEAAQDPRVRAAQADVPIPFSNVVSVLNRTYREKYYKDLPLEVSGHRDRWFRKWQPGICFDGLPRFQQALLSQLRCGECPLLGGYIKKIGPAGNNYRCRWCGVYDETVAHVFANCTDQRIEGLRTSYLSVSKEEEKIAPNQTKRPLIVMMHPHRANDVVEFVLKALDLIGREDSNLKVARDIHNARVAQAE